MWVGHVAGGALGGASSAITTWLVFTPFRTYLPDPARVVLLVGLLGVCALVDLKIVRLPFKGKQVSPLWVSRFGAARAFTLYGILLGSGVATYVPYAAALGLLGVLGLMAPPVTAAVAGAAFGAGRALVVGPASLLPDLSSRLFFRSKASAKVFPAASVLLAMALGGLLVTGNL